jgi:hypothetical protein
MDRPIASRPRSEQDGQEREDSAHVPEVQERLLERSRGEEEVAAILRLTATSSACLHVRGAIRCPPDPEVSFKRAQKRLTEVCVKHDLLRKEVGGLKKTLHDPKTRIDSWSSRKAPISMRSVCAEWAPSQRSASNRMRCLGAELFVQIVIVVEPSIPAVRR